MSENDQRKDSVIPDQDETQVSRQGYYYILLLLPGITFYTQVDGITNLMSVDDVADFLRTIGIPSKFCDVFKGITDKIELIEIINSTMT